MQQDEEARKARWRLQMATILASAVASFGIVIGYLGVVEALRAGGPQAPGLGEALAGPPLGALGAAYLVWGCYWGIPAVWGKWRSLVSSLSQTGCLMFVNPGTLLILVLLFFYIPLVGGYFYGVLGGGFYEYWKCRQRV
jgi:hypothetical protein